MALWHFISLSNCHGYVPEYTLPVTEETVAVVLIDTVFVVCLSSSVPTFSFAWSFFISTVNKDALSGEDVAEVVFVLNIM